MPRLPDATSLGQRPSLPGGRPAYEYKAGIAEQAAAEAAGDGAALGARFAKGFADLAGKQQDAQDKLQTANATTALLGRKAALDRAFDADPEPATYARRYAEQLLAVADAGAAGIAAPDARALFQGLAQRHIARGQADIQDRVRRNAAAAGAGDVDSALGGIVETAKTTQDPDARAALLGAAGDLIEGGHLQGYFDAAAAESRCRTFTETYVGGLIDGWVEQQPDRFAAVEQLGARQIADPALNRMLGVLPVEQTERMFARHLDRLADMAASWSQAEAARRKQLQDQADADMAAVLFDRTLRPDQRWDLFARRKGLVGWSENQRAAIETVLRGEAPVRDDPHDLAQLSDQVRTGRIRTIPGLIEDIGANGRAVSLEMIQARLKPMLEARQNARFTDALDYGYRTLGAEPDVSAPISPDAADTATLFEARLLRDYRQSPDGDLMQATDDIVQRLEEDGSNRAHDALPGQQKAYAAALQSNDLEGIASARTALDAGGKVADPENALEIGNGAGPAEANKASRAAQQDGASGDPENAVAETGTDADPAQAGNANSIAPDANAGVAGSTDPNAAPQLLQPGQDGNAPGNPGWTPPLPRPRPAQLGGSASTSASTIIEPSKRYTNDPGPVRLPTGGLIEDNKSPTGYLMTSGVDLNRLAADARAVGNRFQQSLRPNDEPQRRVAERQLRFDLAGYISQGGFYDEQREAAVPYGPFKVTGPFTQHRELVHVSNFNVGLFSQQAGLSLHDTLKIAGTYAKKFGSNADPNDVYGLGAEARELTEKGWFAGQLNGFPTPAGNIELDAEFYRLLSSDMGAAHWFIRQVR